MINPIDEKQLEELTLLYISRFGFNANDAQVFRSLLRRVYAEGRCRGVQEMSKELRTTLDTFKLPKGGH